MALKLITANIYPGAGTNFFGDITLEQDKIVTMATKTIPSSAPALSMDDFLAMVSKADVAQQNLTVNAENYLIVPGFVDLQVNGSGGIVANQVTSLSELNHMVHSQIMQGTTSFFPTFITDSTTKRLAFLRLMLDYQQQYGLQSGIAGVHLEGPFINVAKRGTHDAQYIKPLDRQDVEMLSEFVQHFPILLTVAPELQDPQLLEQLQQVGVVVFAGHTQATATEAESVFSRHLCQGVTHIFNAMTGLTSREPNLLGSALLTDRLYLSCIPDGFHVDFRSLKLMQLALQARQYRSRLFAISDTFSPDMPEGFRLNIGNIEIFSQAGRYVNNEGRLAGSAITLLTALQNLVHHLKLDLLTAVPMVSSYATDAMHLTGIGRLQPGNQADLVILDQQLRLMATIKNGKFYPAHQSIGNL